MNFREEVDLALVARSICDAADMIFIQGVGGGAFKQVFQVELRNGDMLALKVVRAAEISARTVREVEAMIKCEHPNIAKILNVGTHTFRGVPFHFMLEELLSGGTLADLVQDKGLLTDIDLGALGGTLIDVLRHLAELRLVHRDIKPANILFRDDRVTPILTDFGLVRDLNASSLTQSWLAQGPGTPYFAAPEQLNNQKELIDWRTDQFALGTVLYFVRFGRHPYQYPSEPVFDASTVNRVANREPRSLQFENQLQESSFVCLRRMTEPWPVSRFRTPQDLASAWALCRERYNDDLSSNGA